MIARTKKILIYPIVQSMEVKDIKKQWFGPQTHRHIPAIFINTKIHSYIKRFNLEKQILITIW